MKRVTVRDVASEAGVCLATVDRVINNRPGVRAATRTRVNAAIERLGFQRDAFAASLATGRQDNITFILPGGGTNTFFTNMADAVREAAPRYAGQRVVLSVVTYRELEEAELLAALAAVDLADCAGIAVVAIDSAAIREAIEAIIAGGVPVVTLVSDVTPSRRLHCVGIDNIAAGRVAGSLIGRFCSGKSGRVAVIGGAMTLRDHVERRFGFEQVMRPEFPALEVLPMREGRDHSATTARITRELLAAHHDLVAIYSLGAGNRGIIEAIEESGRALVVVAHELTAHSRAALVSGIFDAVLHQDAHDEIDSAVEVLKAAQDHRTDFTPRRIGVDIFVRDNLP